VKKRRGHLSGLHTEPIGIKKGSNGVTVGWVTQGGMRGYSRGVGVGVKKKGPETTGKE